MLDGPLGRNGDGRPDGSGNMVRVVTRDRNHACRRVNGHSEASRRISELLLLKELREHTDLRGVRQKGVIII